MLGLGLKLESPLALVLIVRVGSKVSVRVGVRTNAAPSPGIGRWVTGYCR